MVKKNNLSFIITGPTGVGKTDFSISIANKIDAEIINIDVGQFYTPLNIGTSKPNWKNESIPHHFFDIVNNQEDFTAFDYREAVKTKLNEILAKDKIPIFVGGSGFYIQTLMFPPQIRKISEHDKIIKDYSWQKLYEIDPARAKQINKNDIYRIQRALDIWQATKLKPSEYKPIYNPLSNFILIVLFRDRDELYKLINERVIEMIKKGWIEETSNLSNDWKLFLKRKKIIGYDDIINFLELKSNDIDLLVETIQKKVRNYAKRQIIFFKTLSKKIIKSELELNDVIYAKKIIWINLSHVNIDSCIDDIFSLFT